MSEHFNELTPARHERLALLAEECAEVICIVGKILRHGYDSYNPDDPSAGDNRTQLAREIGDVRFAVGLLLDHLDIEETEVEGGETDAAIRKFKYLHHQVSRLCERERP